MATTSTATTLTSEVPAEEVIPALSKNYRAGKPMPLHEILPLHEPFMKAYNQKKIYNHDEKRYMVKGPSTRLVAGSLGEDEEDTAFLARWGLISALFHAYSTHHDLVLRPDDIWIAILTQFSFYFQANAEIFRSRFVDHEGKETIEVEGGGTLSTADYEGLCAKIVEVMGDKIKDKDFLGWLTPAFTTTTKKDTMVENVALMATMHAYFDFKCCLSCGLPSVTLEGSEEDWVLLRERIEGLLDFELEDRVEVVDTYEKLKAEVLGLGENIAEGYYADLLKKRKNSPDRYKEVTHMGGLMGKWVAYLRPVLDLFVETKRGVNTMDWFQTLATIKGGGSGPSFLQGWATVFCLFDKDGKWMGEKKTDGYAQIEDKGYPIVDLSCIPAGVLSVPMKVDDNGVEYDTTLFAGTMSMVSKGGKDLRPRQDWAMAVVAPPKEE